MMRSRLPRTHRRPATIAVLLAVAAVTTACDKAQLLAPTSSSITVSAPTRVLPLGGSTEISASVVEQAGTQVQNGTTVRFTTSLGRVDPIEAQTRNGIATTTFYAGDTSGVAEVRAVSGGIGGTTTGSTTATNVVQITIGGAAASAVVLSASPSTVPSTGGTVTLIAAAVDASGNRLSNVPVTFSTTAGTLSASSATTDGNGDARVQLTTNRQATVTARAGGQTATATVNVASPATLALSVSPNPATVGSPVTLTVTPTIASGSPAPRVEITWGDGTASDLGIVTAARGVTHTYTVAGTFPITASATTDGETTSTSTTVTVGLLAPTITASATSGTTSTTFAFTVTPAANTAPTNVVVEFGDGSSVELGAITAATTVTKRYTSTGAYTVRATQTNSAGTTSSPGVVVVTVN